MALTEDFITECLRAVETDPSSYGYQEMEVSSDTLLRCAAVLLPLVFQDEAWHLLYTRRAERMLSHQGQVSFPGGACEEGEATPEQTALREAFEEVGILPDDVRILGRLNPMVTISSFRVTPVVGVVPWPYVFRVQSTEVARVFTIPLLWLAESHNRWEFAFPGRARNLIAYHPFDGELLWGATARITVDFLRMLGFREDSGIA
jgi:8-oxo-dGTP pyrophosphatase MutT (NUDIX family)